MNTINKKFGKSQGKSLIQQNSTSQEIIVLRSDSEIETSEPKKSEDSLWKLRPPKTCSKYVPEDEQDKDFKENEGWLKKQSITFG